MQELADGARISLEGDLHACNFTSDLVVTFDEDGILTRNTLSPRLDFIVLRLDVATVAAIFEQVVIAGLSEAIIHVQIERAGVLQLGAYDNFHPDCVVTGPAVQPALLSELKSKSIVRNFGSAE
jgi:hypothetical protein